jgi:hypothetical protein
VIDFATAKNEVPATSLDHLEKMKAGGYAPGGYLGECRDCGSGFIGDKRAWRCCDCALGQVSEDAER